MATEGDVIGYGIAVKEYGTDDWQHGETLSSLKDVDAAVESENVIENAAGFGDVVVTEVRVVRVVT